MAKIKLFSLKSWGDITCAIHMYNGGDGRSIHLIVTMVTVFLSSSADLAQKVTTVRRTVYRSMSPASPASLLLATYMSMDK